MDNKVTKCIIVDDEPPAIKVLENYIECVPQLKIASTCKNAFEAINVLNSERIDLMFLDIHMPKLIGTDLVKTLHSPPKVIFTTAHKDFAIEAFDLDAIDYLLKPFSFERFLKAVNKYCQTHTFETIFKDLDHGFLYFRADRKMVKVFVDNILYIESFKDYIIIHRENDIDLKIKLPIGNMQNMLPQHLFMRIHRSFIVSLNKITAFTKNDIEIGKVEIPVGRSYPDVFKKLSPYGTNFLEDEK